MAPHKRPYPGGKVAWPQKNNPVGMVGEMFGDMHDDPDPGIAKSPGPYASLQTFIRGRTHHGKGFSKSFDPTSQESGPG